MILDGYGFLSLRQASTTKHGNRRFRLSAVGFSNKFEGHSSLLSHSADLATAQMCTLPKMWLSRYSVERNPRKLCPFYWATLERQSAVWSSLWEVLRSRCCPFQLQVACNSPTVLHQCVPKQYGLVLVLSAPAGSFLLLGLQIG